jgi:hypothetical protein
LQPVNHAVLAVLNPEQVEVEIWRSDELERTSDSLPKNGHPIWP